MNLVMTGFMGTGKSSVGRLVAEALALDFVDTDDLIVERAGMEIKDIFAVHGEARFRELEREVIEEVTSTGTNLVLATGGGAVVDPVNRERLKGWGVVVCLTASFDAILSRVGGGDERPLLGEEEKTGVAESRARTLMEERRAAYEEAELTVDTTALTTAEVATAVLQYISQK